MSTSSSTTTDPQPHVAVTVTDSSDADAILRHRRPPPQEDTILEDDDTADADNAKASERTLKERLWEVVVNYLPLSWVTFGGPQ
ncbi:hypothetical protein HDU96_000486, partial [Phlyctochytrium bullatum]